MLWLATAFNIKQAATLYLLLLYENATYLLVDANASSVLVEVALYMTTWQQMLQIFSSYHGEEHWVLH